MPKHIDFDREEFLMNVHGDIEARIIESKLKLHGIPVMRKYRGSSAYINLYTGNTVFGIDLYVPSRALDTAKDIVGISNAAVGCDCENDAGTANKTMNYSESFNIDEKEGDPALKKSQDRRRIHNSWFILVLITSGLLLLIIYVIRKLLEHISHIK